jgi:hypothetical protein
LQRDDPELAARCKELDPQSVKGFRQKVRIFEVPWMIGENVQKLEKSAPLVV